MLFNVGFHDRAALLGSALRQVRGQWPHLRLVPLVDPAAISGDMSSLPPHVAKIIQLHPDASTLGSLNCVVSSDPANTSRLLPQIPYGSIVTWDGMADAYKGWMQEHYLPFHRSVALYTPDGLRPVGLGRESVSLEVVGGCSALFVLHYAEEAAKQLEIDVSTTFIAQNHPVAVERGATPVPDVQLVMPPLRFMHPETLDDFIVWTAHGQRFKETVAHLEAYLDRVAEGLPAKHRFVANFMEPTMDPVDVDFARGSYANFKTFVRGLNDALAAWCDRHAATWLVDASEVSAAIGRGRTDEELVRNVAHRTTANPMDDWVDEPPVAAYSVAESYDMQTEAFYVSLLRQVFCRRTTVLGREPVKLVITDLDNTLWRGLASDGRTGPWAGRPAGIAEALRVLKRRGILLAIASKNDPGFIAANWDGLLSDMSDEPLGMSLRLDDFVITRIGFQPKSDSVAEILAATNIAASNAVFIDDNPLEREEVQAAFPDLRVLGAELNYVRRELLHSPYTQRHVLTEEDKRRTETTRARVDFYAHSADKEDTNGYLHALNLRLFVGSCVDISSPTGDRCAQLINRANQWSLSGARTDERELAHAVGVEGKVLVYGTVEDAAGSYGIVAVALVDPQLKEISTMAVSCRVIGMGVDEALMSAVLGALGPLRLQSAETGRNMAAQDFVKRHCDAEGALSECPSPPYIQVTSALPEGARSPSAQPLPVMLHL